MNDYTELKKLAEAAGSGQWGYDGSYVCPARTEDGTTYVESWRAVADCYQPENIKFIAAANPAAVLALIAENERLRKEAKYWSDAHDRELEWSAQLIEEREALRADAERYRWLKECNGGPIGIVAWHQDEEKEMVLVGQYANEAIDAAMSKEPKAE